MKTIQKFKCLTQLFVLSAFLFFSRMQCEKNIPEIEKLPPITQTGAGTFGCLVDGVALLPKGSPLSGPVSQCQYQYIVDNTHNGFYFMLKASDQKSYNDGIHGVKIRGNKVLLENKTYSLSDPNVDGCFDAQFYIIHEGLVIEEFSTNTIQMGELTISQYDDPNNIISGTFWFDAINKDGKIVEVREGRFDMHFIK